MPPPKRPEDLIHHRCIDIRYPTFGGTQPWEFEKRGRKVNVRVEGPVILSTSAHVPAAALAGLGIAFLPEEEFAPFIAEGRLISVLADWCPAFSGYHIYYPSRRLPTPAFSLVLEALRRDPDPSEG